MGVFAAAIGKRRRELRLVRFAGAPGDPLPELPRMPVRVNVDDDDGDVARVSAARIDGARRNQLSFKQIGLVAGANADSDVMSAPIRRTFRLRELVV